MIGKYIRTKEILEKQSQVHGGRQGLFCFLEHRCKCGCNGEIKLNPKRITQYERIGFPQFISGHNSFGATNPNYIDGRNSYYPRERQHSIRSGRGFMPLNNKSKLFDTVHHVDTENVIFIPEKIHRIPHSQKDEESMKYINMLAFACLEASVL